jgi:invasion protein IalB
VSCFCNKNKRCIFVSRSAWRVKTGAFSCRKNAYIFSLCNPKKPVHSPQDKNMKEDLMRLQPLKTLIICMLVTLSVSITCAKADEPALISTHGDWSAYSFVENGNTVCYMVAKPQKAEGKYTTRGEPYVLITHRPAEGSRDVFSYIAGYPYKAGSAAKLDISGKAFSLFTQDETAWAADAAADARIAAALKKGDSLIVKGTSRKGTDTVDTYSLKGSSAAYDAMSKACGL